MYHMSPENRVTDIGPDALHCFLVISYTYGLHPCFSRRCLAFRRTSCTVLPMVSTSAEGIAVLTDATRPISVGDSISERSSDFETTTFTAVPAKLSIIGNTVSIASSTEMGTRSICVPLIERAPFGRPLLFVVGLNHFGRILFAR